MFKFNLILWQNPSAIYLAIQIKDSITLIVNAQSLFSFLNLKFKTIS